MTEGMSEVSDVMAKIQTSLESQAFFGTSVVPAPPSEPLTLAKLTELCEGLMKNAPPPMPRIIESIYCSDATQDLDWSGARSPSRAKRRRRMGHRQRVKIVRVPWKHAVKLPDGKLVMHPVAAQLLKAPNGPMPGKPYFSQSF